MAVHEHVPSAANLWASFSSPKTEADEGLRLHMLGIYNRMAGGLLLTFCLSLGLHLAGFSDWVSEGWRGYWLLPAPLGLSLWVHFRRQAKRIGPTEAGFCFWAMSAALGALVSVVWRNFAMAEISVAFLAAAVSFGSLSVWGYATRRDLTPLWMLAAMLFSGLSTAYTVNLFIGSEGLRQTITYLGIVVYSLLTALESNMLRLLYLECDDPEERRLQSIIGAMNLHFDFIALFAFILRAYADSRKD